MIQKVVNQTLAAQPDAVLLVGDYVTTSAQDAIHLQPLAQLAQSIPTFAIWGNHDYHLGNYPLDYEDQTSKTDALFREAGISVLNNENQTIRVHGMGLNIAGIDELWGYFDDIEKALDISNTYPTILMSHNPDAINQLQDPLFADLMVSGHTHGGQIRLPLIGSLVSVPTELGNDFDKGLFSWQNGTQLYITPGIGVTGVRARLFNPPTISLLKLY
jgi:predicted MPP superfamily phosphohydrolase